MYYTSQNKQNFFRDLWLYIGSFALFLYIHFPLILRFGYDVDEILDYTGSSIARDVYLSIGRWGLVLWGNLVGAGMKPLSGGMTAGLILCLALILQTKLLFSETTPYKYKAIFCAIYIATGQFAYTVVYSMQTEGFAISCLLSTLACFVLFYKQPQIKISRAIYATLILFFGLSFYQTSGLVYYCLFCCCLLRASHKKIISGIITLGATSLCAIILFTLSKQLIIAHTLPSTDAVEFTRQHESHSLSTGILYTKASFLHLLKKLYFCSIACNLYLQTAFHLALIYIAYTSVKRKQFASLALIGLCILAPYSILLLIEPSPRMFLFLPLISSYFIVYTITQLSTGPVLRNLGYSFIAIACIFASHKSARVALFDRTRHEHGLLERFAQYHEARKLILNAGCNGCKIIVFEKGWNKKAPDFYHSYPFKNFHLGTQRDYDTHRNKLEQMPAWPAEGSVQENQGEIIVKGNKHW